MNITSSYKSGHRIVVYPLSYQACGTSKEVSAALKQSVTPVGKRISLFNSFLRVTQIVQAR